jgi:acyl CoA:acetate/3-ketoacid CoA transferase alpha subunit
MLMVSDYGIPENSIAELVKKRNYDLTVFQIMQMILVLTAFAKAPNQKKMISSYVRKTI